MPYYPEDTGAQDANVVDISGSDADELGGKLGGAIGGSFNPAWIIPGYGMGAGGSGLQGGAFVMWVDNGTLHVRCGGTTYSCALSALDAWTVGMINSLYEQWVIYNRT